jgi:arginase family enzyme
MLYDFIETLSREKLSFNTKKNWELLNNVTFFDNENIDFQNIDLAIVGVEEERGAPLNKGTANAPNAIRKECYRLSSMANNLKILDLGNIKAGAELKDTYFALSCLLSDFVEKKVFVIILGGSQDLTISQFNAYEGKMKSINMVVIDESFDIDNSLANKQDYLMDIFKKEDNNLFHFTNIGYQTYFVNDQIVASMEKMKFDCYRLGHFKHNLAETEVILRDADLISFDVSSLKQSEAPARGLASPNGFYSEDVCQIARYAGISDKLSTLGLYELNPIYDNNMQSAKLLAQMIWYVLDGYVHRHFEKPDISNENYMRYMVDSDEGEKSMVFWKSKKSGRWWMEVPFSQIKSNHERNRLVSCTYRDYQEACGGEIPNRWINAYEKLC